MLRPSKTAPAAAALLLLSVSLRAQIFLDADERLTLDGDAVQTPVTFFLKIGDPPVLRFPPEPGDFQGISSWQVQVFDSSGSKISYVQGKGRPTSPWIPWSGFSSEGRALPDGFYRAQFIWEDSSGDVHKTPPITVSVLVPPVLRELYDLAVLFSRTSEGLIVRIPDLMLFESGRYELRDEAVPSLTKVAKFLRSSHKNKVVIRGHSDSLGDAASNLKLSTQRAQSVRRFLIENGIDPSRLTYEGRGSSEPVASNDTKEGRAKNRRVDIVVLKA